MRSGPAGTSAECRGSVLAGHEPGSLDAEIHVVLASRKWSGVDRGRTAERGTALSYNSPRQKIREDFGTVRADYVPRESDTLSLVYTVDDGDSLTPLADPLFRVGPEAAKPSCKRAGSARFLTSGLEHFAGRVLAGCIQLRFVSVDDIFTGRGICPGEWSRRHSDLGGLDDHRPFRDYRGRAKQRRERGEPQKSVHLVRRYSAQHR